MFDLAEQAHDLPLMQQQSSGALGIPVENIALLIGGDMQLIDDHFTVFDAAPRVFHINIAETDGLDFGATKLDAGFQFLFHKILVVSLPVAGHYLDVVLLQLTHLQEIFFDYYITIVKCVKQLLSNLYWKRIILYDRIVERSDV